MTGRDDQGLIPLPDKDTFRPHRRDADPARGIFAYVRGRQQVMNFGGERVGLETGGRTSPARASFTIMTIAPMGQDREIPIMQPTIDTRSMRDTTKDVPKWPRGKVPRGKVPRG